MGYPIKMGQTAQPLLFLMISSTDHISGKTGLSPTVTLSKNGGSFAAPAGAVAEVGNGWYAVAGNATDSVTLGPLLLHATGAGADPCDERFDVVGFDPQDVPVAVWDKVAVNTTTHGEIHVAVAAVLCGKATENATHTATAFSDINDPDTIRINSTNFATERTVTVN